MSESSFAQLPTDVLNYLVPFLELPDLKALRLTCRDINDHTFHAMARRCFTRVSTTLMGPDNDKLQGLADHERLRSYVKTIYVEDHYRKLKKLRRRSAMRFHKRVEEDELEKLPDSVLIWPRKEDDGEIADDAEIDLSSINTTLLGALWVSGKLRPDTFVFRDCRRALAGFGSTHMAHLAYEFLKIGAWTAVTSVREESVGADDHRFIAQISPHYEGESSRLSDYDASPWQMLRTARLDNRSDMYPVWRYVVLFHAPALEDLHLTFGHRCPPPPADPPCFPKLSSRIKRLNIDGAPVNAQVILKVIELSQSTLTTLCLSGLLHAQSTWHDILRQINLQCRSLNSIALFGLFQENNDKADLFRRICQITFPSFDNASLIERYAPGLSVTRHTYPDRQLVVSINYEGDKANDVLEQAIACMKAVPSTVRSSDIRS